MNKFSRDQFTLKQYLVPRKTTQAPPRNGPPKRKYLMLQSPVYTHPSSPGHPR